MESERFNMGTDRRNLIICGLQKTTLLDFPGHLAATIFLGGCNFRCPFCHNSGIVDGMRQPGSLEEGKVMEFLEKRRNVLQGVCISGGEPTLQPEGLERILRFVHSMGLLAKLDTNGYRPEVIRHLTEEGLLDYIAMDIKAGQENYEKASGVRGIKMEPIRESVRLLKEGNVPYEFRTTVVKGIHSESDFKSIGPWISGCPRYYLQSYEEMELASWQERYGSFSKDELTGFAELVRPFVGQVSLRGID